MQMNPAQLLELSDEKFRQLVDEEVRGTAPPEVGTLLRDPLVLKRWYNTLVKMKKSVESQLSAKRSDILMNHSLTQTQIDERWSEFHRWRGGAVRFKSGVEDRLIEIRAIRGKTSPDADAIKRERNSLLEAISIHRETVLREFAEDEISDADRALWAALGG